MERLQVAGTSFSEFVRRIREGNGIPMNRPTRDLSASVIPLRELLLAQRRQWREGKGIPLEVLLHEHPWVREDPEGLLDLIYAEYLERERAGDHPDVADYVRRFPECADSLARQIDLHQALDSVSAGFESGPNSLFPAAPSFPAIADVTSAKPPSITGYEILGEIGRGGMGIVYRARQVALGRDVAIKMLRFGGLADDRSHRLFRREASTIARLRHPNVVQIHDFGLLDGSPYLILEFIDAGTLSQRIGGTPQPYAWSAEQVETLASAMEYAHGNQVIHRDLKPANVLVTSQGILKISDFGLAKEVASAAETQNGVVATQTEAVFGTPGYMAPEQLLGKHCISGPAIDIYGLGAILYELLTGRAPFVGRNVMEICERIRLQEPLPPHRIRAGVPRDLETICLKCLRKEATQRYLSAADLAEDLRRFRMGEPILARPTGVVVRSIRWCRRHPLVASLWIALISSLCIGLALVTFLWLASDRLLRESQDNLRLATEAVDAFFSKVSDDPRLAAHDLRELRRELLRTAVEFDKQFVAKSDNKAESQLELARAYARLGRVTAEIDTAAEASSYLDAASSLLEPLSAKQHPSPDVMLDLVRTHIALGRIHDRLGNTSASEIAFRRSLTALDSIQPIYRSLDCDILRFQALQGLAHASFRSKPGTEAEAMYLQALALGQRLQRDAPDSTSLAFELANCQASLGSFYRARQIERVAEAEAALLESARLLRHLILKEPDVSEYQTRLARTLIQLGELYAIRKSWDQANTMYLEAIALHEQVVNTHPSVLEYRAGLFRSRGILANSLGLQDRVEEAKSIYREVIDAWTQLAKEDRSNLDFQVQSAQSRSQMATLLMGKEALEEAESILRDAASIIQSLEQTHATSVAVCSARSNILQGLANIQTKQGRFEEAVRSWELALDDAPLFLQSHYRGELALTRLRAGEVDRGLKEAAEVEAGIPVGSVGGTRHTLLVLARAACVAATQAKNNIIMSLEDRTSVERRHLTHAITLVGRSVDAGMNEPQALREDPLLVPLRDSPEYAKEFAALVARAAEQTK
jgi:eukaryotic-like serine/threonine-protein kinase